MRAPVGLMPAMTARAGAARVAAADVDPYAVVACRLNAEANGVAVEAACTDPLAGGPPDADVVRWRQELDRADRTRFRRTAWPVAVSLLPIALGVAGLSDPAARPVAILLIVLFVGLDVATLLAVPARRRRVERLRAALDPHD